MSNINFISMKKVVSLIICFVIAHIAINADTCDAILLKNGESYRGEIIEKNRNSVVKIKLDNGAVFSCRYSDVQRFYKIDSATGQESIEAPIDRTFKLKKEYPQLGYRGFADVGYSFGIGGYGLNRFEVTTIHGCQILPALYVGGGVGFSLYEENYLKGDWKFSSTSIEQGQMCSIPVFVDIRTDILKSWISPFVDVRIGYAFLEMNGFYFSVMAGGRTALSFGNNTIGINLGIGYTTTLKNDVYKGKEISWGTISCGAIALKLGVDF